MSPISIKDLDRLIPILASKLDIISLPKEALKTLSKEVLEGFIFRIHTAPFLNIKNMDHSEIANIPIEELL